MEGRRWEEKLGKEKLLEKKKKFFFCFQGETHMEYSGLGIANFALTLLYPNIRLWKGEQVMN